MAQPPPYVAQNPKSGFVPPGAAPPYPVGFEPPMHQPNISYASPVSPQNRIVVSSDVIITTLGPNPQQFTCPFCHQVSRTRIQTEANSKTHLFAIFMCVFLCWPCCFIPYCVDSCKSKNHYCGNCGAFIGTFDS